MDLYSGTVGGIDTSSSFSIVLLMLYSEGKVHICTVVCLPLVFITGIAKS